jgi:hypothetical protein
MGYRKGHLITNDSSVQGYSTGCIVINRDRRKANTQVPATKQAAKMYQVSSSNTSVNAGTCS